MTTAEIATAPAGAGRAELDSIRSEIVSSTGGLALFAATANVLMQLSQLPVGYGVAQSVVESGRADVHPIKRARTTLTYLSVAWEGTEEDRAAYRRAVNKSHAQVNSKNVERVTGEKSPVAYNAFDSGLQLWVAVCLFRGTLDVMRFSHPKFAREERERILRAAATLGTSLQVTEDMWPASFGEFEEYWAREEAERVHIDDTVRKYLDDLVRLRFSPVAGPLFGWVSHFFTVGFLPPKFRAEMRYTWRPWQDFLFRSVMLSLGAVHRRMPRSVRRFPFNVYLWDLRRRIRLGKPLV